jgi:hypothetical protein
MFTEEVDEVLRLRSSRDHPESAQEDAYILCREHRWKGVEGMHQMIYDYDILPNGPSPSKASKTGLASICQAPASVLLHLLSSCPLRHLD